MGDAETPGMPALLMLTGLSAVVIGGTDEATALAAQLLSHGAVVTVVAASATLRLHALAASDRLVLQAREYVRGDLAGARMAVCCDGGELVDAVAAEARVERCLFFAPSRPDLSTARLTGACPPPSGEESE